MACDCFDKMNATAEALNVRMISTYYFAKGDQPGFSTPTIETEKIAPRKKGGGRFTLTYCPFCGTRYLPVAEEVDDAKQVAA